MAEYVSSFAPNSFGALFPAAGATTWFVVGQDPTTPGNAPTLHASLAALAAAGKVPWPFAALGNADPQSITLRCDNAANADGALFLVAFSRSDAALPTDATADLEISGAGQTFNDLQFHNLWIKQTVTTDRIRARVRW